MSNTENLPNIDLMFEPFCKNCEQAKLKIIDGDRVYAGNVIYQISTSITCEHVRSCRRIYNRFCKKEEDSNG